MTTGDHSSVLKMVPVIDLDGRGAEVPPRHIVSQVSEAAASHGFFQIINHGIRESEIDAVWKSTDAFFELDADTKRQINRTKENSRGYYDRELTKNKRDLKEVLDLAQVPFPDLPENHPSNRHSVDGQNQWPDLVGFRGAITAYLRECNDLALWLLSAFCIGLDEVPTHLHAAFEPIHTSFLRLNHYPLGDLLDESEAADVTALGDMALHHHTDAGALTLLLQDDVGGLQVAFEGTWIDVPSIPGALVVNTGDMMQVWSNDRYKAALHRVVPRTNRSRSSLPYFFNPSYETDYAPLPGSISAGDSPHYRTINWGNFRQARSDGDFADYGTEVQISDFCVDMSGKATTRTNQQ